MTERWAPIRSFEGRYEVSDLGRVRRIAHVDDRGRRMPERLLKPFPSGRCGAKGNYRAVYLGRRAKRLIHRMVLEAFVRSAAPGEQACHINGVPSDNRLENLRWGTATENQADSIRHGTKPRGEKHGNAVFSRADIQRVFELRAAGCSQTSIGRQLGMSQTHVSDILRGRARKQDMQLGSAA